MKIIRFTSLGEAQIETDRLVAVLNLPATYRYGSPFQTHDGTWALKVKENGNWPATGVIQGKVEDYEWPTDLET